jgi:sirohydrochlorin ferrochelatase
MTRRYGVLVISHGSRDRKWVELVREACASVNLPAVAGYAPLPMMCSFLELVDGALIQDGIDGLQAQGVTDMIVVPLFISSGSTHIDEISWALGAKSEPELPTDLEQFRVHAAVHFCDPIDDDPEIAQLIVNKLSTITVDPSKELLLLVGHGSKEQGFHKRWRKGLDSLAKQAKQIGGFAEADTVMLLPDEAASKLHYWKHARPELDAVVAPLFLSEGYFTSEVIPKRLVGNDYKYTGSALLPSPYITAWMERRIAECIEMIEKNG